MPTHSPELRPSHWKAVYHPSYRKLIATLVKARRQCHMSQESVARAMGMGRQWISKVEHHDVRLDVLALVRLCRIYRIPATRLVRRMEEELSAEDDSFLGIRVLTEVVLGIGLQFPLFYYCSIRVSLKSFRLSKFVRCSTVPPVISYWRCPRYD